MVDGRLLTPAWLRARLGTADGHEHAAPDHTRLRLPSDLDQRFQHPDAAEVRHRGRRHRCCQRVRGSQRSGRPWLTSADDGEEYLLR